VLDGGSAYAQRRTEQGAADLAALAGANDFWLNGSATQATARARTVAAANGFTHGVNNVTVNVNITTPNGAWVKVDINSPHANNFASIVGMSNWTVSTTATAEAGLPDTAEGAGPILFSVDDFAPNGQPLASYGDSNNPHDFGQGNGDFPTGPSDVSWTNWGIGNVDTDQVGDIIDGSLVVTKTLAFGEYVGQQNSGYHTALFDSGKPCDVKPSIQSCLAGTDIVVPIVDHNGMFQGWATFHVTSASGASGKDISGYFVSNFINERLSVGSCSLGSCPLYFGNYALHLVN
jgi:hypothetical protein